MLYALQVINLIIGIPSALFVLLTTLCKPFRKWLMGRREDRENSHETDKCLLRDRITSIYYEHRDTKTIDIYEYENMERLYNQYKYLQGNSFVDKIWKEVKDTWNVIR